MFIYISVYIIMIAAIEYKATHVRVGLHRLFVD